MPGDVIIDIDGTDVVGRDPSEVQGHLKGDPHSPVTLIYQRTPGSDPLVITLLRALGPDGTPAPAALSPPKGMHTTQTRAVPIHQERVQRVYDEPSPEDPVSSLRSEFATMSFLWGEPMRDPGVAALVEWKDELLYGEVVVRSHTKGELMEEREVVA